MDMKPLRRHSARLLLLPALVALVVGLVGPVAPSAQAGPAAQASQAPPTRAHASALDQKLRNGCRAYAFRYRVNLPDFVDRWYLRLQLVDDDDRRTPIRIREFESTDGDPKVDRRAWRLCGRELNRGTYRIQVWVGWDYDDGGRAGWQPTSAFEIY